MAGVINSTARQIDLRFRVEQGGISTVQTVTLNPGFNVVEDCAWEESIKNPVVQQYLEGGALIGNSKQSREDVLMKQEAQRLEGEKNVHQIERTAGAASAVKGQARPMSQRMGSQPAIARGAGAGGKDVVETGAKVSDDLLG